MISPHYGVCVQNTDGIITHQNNYCIDVCQNQIGKSCHLKHFSLCDLANKTVEEKVYFSSGEILKNQINSKEKCYENIQTYDVCAIPGPNQVDLLFYSTRGRFETILKEIEPYVTSKQKEIVTLRLLGKSRSEISKRLNISPNTLKTHFRNITTSLPEDLKHLIRKA